MKFPSDFPIGNYCRVGERWFKIIGHETTSPTVNTFDLDRGVGVAIRFECIDEVTDMGRPRKNPVEKKTEVTDSLLEAIKFCSPGFKESGEVYATHALIWGGWITTYNGIVQFGHPIESPLQCAPHFGRLHAAIAATEGLGIQMTQTDSGRLSIKAKGFKTVVPCCQDLSLVMRSPVDPTNPAWVLDSRMREGFELMKQISSKAGETIATAAVLIRNGDMIATDRHILVQFWHGIGFPELAVPADFIEAVLKVQRPLVGFGFTQDQSLTFFFDNNSFIRTQLYAEKYPDVSRALPASWEGLQPVPEAFFASLAKIKPFTDKSYVYCYPNEFRTDPDSNVGTVIECPGLLDGPSGLDLARISKLNNRITHIDYTDRNHHRFIGENIRGVCTTFYFDDETSEEKSVEQPSVPTAQHWQEENVKIQSGTEWNLAIQEAIETETVDVGVQTIKDWHSPQPEIDTTDEPVDEPVATGGWTLPA